MLVDFILILMSPVLYVFAVVFDPRYSALALVVILLFFIASYVGIVQMRRLDTVLPARFVLYMRVEIFAIMLIAFIGSVTSGNSSIYFTKSYFFPSTVLVLNTLALIFFTIKAEKGRRLLLFTLNLPLLLWLFAVSFYVSSFPILNSG
jgi:hypothetical protein